MIKVFREFLFFVRDDGGFIGGGIIERIMVYGAGILGLSLLVFSWRMVMPDSQIASQSVSTTQMTERACVVSGIEAAVRISALEDLRENKE